jgi:hypothetical protein
MRPFQAHCHAGLGTLYTTTGHWEQARTALSTAIALYRPCRCRSGCRGRRPRWRRWTPRTINMPEAYCASQATRLRGVLSGGLRPIPGKVLLL